MRVEFEIRPPDESQSFSVTLDAIPRKNDLVSYASPHGIIIRPVLSVRWHIGRGTWDDQTKAVVSLGKVKP